MTGDIRYLSVTDREYAQRALDALQAGEVRGMTPSVVAKRAGLDTATARRLLNVLVDEGRAHMNGTKSRYWPGRAR